MKVHLKTRVFIAFLCATGSISASLNMKTADKDSKRKVETERKPLNARTQPHIAGAYALSLSKNQQKAKESASAPVASKAKAATPLAAAAAPVAAAQVAPQKALTKRSCMVCMDDKKDERFIQLSCGHDLTCFRCLKAMLLNVFKDKTTAQFKCPEVKCKKELGLADVKALTATVAKWNAFDSIVLKEAFAKNPLMRNCPTPKCTVMYELADLDPEAAELVKCENCKKSYCSHCQILHSDNITCAEAKENHALTSDRGKVEKATEELIKKTSKPCPKCKVSIEKDQGCNQMHCTKCNYYFCWACGAFNISKQPHHVCAQNTTAAAEDQKKAQELFTVALSQASHINVSKQQVVRKFITQAQNIKSYSDAIELFRTAIQHGKVANNIIDSVNRQFQEHFSQGMLLMENVARCVVMIITEMQTRKY